MDKDVKKPNKVDTLEKQLYMNYLLSHVLMDIILEKGDITREDIEIRLDKKNKEWIELSKGVSNDTES